MRRALVVLALLGASCGLFPDGSFGSGGGESDARVLGMFSTELPRGATEQAWQALEQDAWRRETRFQNAIEPGYLLRSTRVEQFEIDRGAWTAPDLYSIGGQLFTLRFTSADGFGGGDRPPMSRFHDAKRGGPDANRCADCHWRGGLAGAGDAADNAMLRGNGESEARAIARNPPPLHGAGLIELLALEMTEELQDGRDELISFASGQGYAVQDELTAKGVGFGLLTARPDGTLEFDKLAGVDDDFVVKPFGWKGTFRTIRDIAEDALLVHHGMQTEFIVANEKKSRIGDGPADDPDDDGVIDEITEGQVSALTLFIAMQETPVEQLPSDPIMVSSYGQGIVIFEAIGCADCHVPSLTLDNPVFELSPRITRAREFEVDLPSEGAQPRAQPDDEGHVRVRLFSDLRRHEMGEALQERKAEQGVPGDQFLTRPLWGLARSRPYLHDGRAPTIEDAIGLHGGEAQASHDAFFALEEHERAALRVFLTSLTRAERLVSP